MEWKLNELGVSYWYIGSSDGRGIFLFVPSYGLDDFKLSYQLPMSSSLSIYFKAQNIEEAKQKALTLIRETLENGMLELDELEGIE